MADKDFDRVIINPRERPLSGDVNRAASQLDRTTRDIFQAFFGRRFNSASDVSIPRDGFMGSAFRVVPTAPPSMTVKVSTGIGFQYNASSVPTDIDSVSDLDDLSTYKPLLLSTQESIALNAAPGVGNERYDIIEVKATYLATDSSSRDILDTGSGAFVPTLVAKTLTWDLASRQGAVASPADSTTPIGYKYGIAAATGTATTPPTTSGYVRIARVLVSASVTTIEEDKIVDYRPVLMPGGTCNAALDFSITTGSAAVFNALLAPPGVRIVVRNTAGTRLSYDVIVFAGSGPTSVVPTVGVYKTGASGSFAHATVSFAPTAGTVDASMQGDLADPATCSPAIDVGIGTPYVMFSVTANYQSGGTTDQATLTNPLQHFVNMTIAS